MKKSLDEHKDELYRTRQILELKRKQSETLQFEIQKLSEYINFYEMQIKEAFLQGVPEFDSACFLIKHQEVGLPKASVVRCPRCGGTGVIPGIVICPTCKGHAFVAIDLNEEKHNVDIRS